MNIEMDSDVQRVAEFMQLNLAATKLSSVAACLAKQRLSYGGIMRIRVVSPCV